MSLFADLRIFGGAAAVALTLPFATARSQDASRVSMSPVVRVALQLDSSTIAQFDARGFDLDAAGATPAATTAEVRLVKRAGAHTSTLLRLSLGSAHVPSAVIDILDSLGAPAITFRLSDVSIISDHLSLSSARANIEQQRISQQEALSALNTDYQEAQRQLATVEELNKTRSTTRVDLARARDRASDLQRRIDLLKQRQALLTRQADEQGPLDETIVLRFTRFEIDGREAGGRATVDVAGRPGAARR